MPSRCRWLSRVPIHPTNSLPSSVSTQPPGDGASIELLGPSTHTSQVLELSEDQETTLWEFFDSDNEGSQRKAVAEDTEATQQADNNILLIDTSLSVVADIPAMLAFDNQEVVEAPNGGGAPAPLPVEAAPASALRRPANVPVRLCERPRCNRWLYIVLHKPRAVNHPLTTP
jgi:hypothetical protein